VAVISMSNSATPSPTAPTLPNAALAVTPSDSNTFAAPVSIYVGGAGVVTCSPANGNTDVAITCVAGMVIPFRVIAVKSTGTTATLMVAIY
jgi:hypothetical protein